MTTKPRTVRATITPDGRPGTKPLRLSFVECEQNGVPTVMVYSATSNYGGYHTARFGDRLGRSWVRSFFANTAHEVTF